MSKKFKILKKQVEEAYPEWAMYEANRKGQIFDPTTKSKVTYPDEHFDMQKVKEGADAWKAAKRGRIIGGVTLGVLTVGGIAYSVSKHHKNQTTEEPKENIEG